MNIDNDCISPDQVYDVLIVGAGPVGLATAIALRKRGINNILVIDQTREFRRVGQIVDLLPNGLKAIKYIDSEAYQHLKETDLELLQSLNQNDSPNYQSEVKEKKALSPKQWHQKNLQGEIIRSVPLDFETWFNRYGEGRISISCYDLQTKLRNLLPSEIVQANHRCVNLEQENKWVRIDCISDAAISINPFAHWEMQSSKLDTPSISEASKESYNKQFQAKLVVAADGINSTVRQVLYAKTGLSEWAKPQYSGFSAIGCLQVANVPDSIREELEVKYFQGDSIFTLSNNSPQLDSQDLEQPRLILIIKRDNSMGYLLHAPLSLDSLQNKSPAEIINLGVEVLDKGGFPPIFGKLISLSPPEKLFHRPYYIHPATIPVDSQPAWSHGRVVLVGDAAHGMPPFAAQGANQGFEDAALISTLITNIVRENCLDDEKVITNEFNKYEQIRSSFMVKIQEATMKNYHWLQQQWEDYNEMVYCRNFDTF